MTIDQGPGKSGSRFFEASSNLSKQASNAVHDMSAEAMTHLSGAAEQAKAQAKQSASALADEAAGQLQDLVNKQLGTGADLIKEAAETARSFADSIENKAPHAAGLIRGAATSVDQFSQNMKGKTAGELVEDASSFARRQPALFFGAAFLGGFAISRFLKSSPRSGDSTPAQSPDHDSERRSVLSDVEKRRADPDATDPDFSDH